MIAVDTNVVARFLLRDDPAQAAIATALLQQPCYIPNTVLLEVAWLLNSRYSVPRATLITLLERLLDLPAVSVSDADGMAWALRRFSQGADFADMMHLLSSGVAMRFATFDADVAPDAGPETPVPVDTLKT